MSIRNNTLLFDDETMFFINLERKRLAGDLSDRMTNDQVANGLIREKLTTENPSWVSFWSEHQEVKANAIRGYKLVEAKALQQNLDSQTSAADYEQPTNSAP